MLPDYRLRRAAPEDQPFLVEMLMQAVNWAPDRDLTQETVLSDPRLSRYLDGWPRRGEIGIVAATGSIPIGAAWLRFFTADRPGYGFVADDVPELSMAVVEAWRGRGVGRALLRRLADEARAFGVRRISLSVERDNFAQGLYTSEGYEVVHRGADSDTMVADLHGPSEGAQG